MEIKTCYRCNDSKEKSLFKIDYKKNKTGTIRYTNICIECNKAEFKAWRTENKEVYNDRYKQRRWERKKRAIEYKGGKCEHCLEILPPECFDFHHIDKETKHKDPGLMMSHSDESLFKELDKCILLCANCHRTEHFSNEY